jgi:ribosome maturation factor RimP
MAMSASSREPRIARETGAARRVAELIEPTLEQMGYLLVRVRVTGEGGATLQIMADTLEGGFGIADCEAISRAIAPMLDVEDPMQGHYRLEVSSPGLARPLVRPSDFERWAGHEAKVEMTEMIAGQKRFRGMLEGYHDGEVRLFVSGDGDAEPVLIGLPFERISDARLMMTDALLAEGAGRREN